MNSTKALTDLVTYNVWANQQIAQWLLSNDMEKMTSDCHSSFPTILQTIHHTWDAQIFYLNIMKNIPFSKDWDGSTEGAINGFVAQSKEFMKHVLPMTANEFSEYRLVEASMLEGEFQQHELIQHCMNHSTFHRGQIITMGHQLGLSKAPRSDFFFYFAEERNIQYT